MALARVVGPSVASSRIYLPASLCSAAVTPLPRSYGRSDSCSAGAVVVLFRPVPSLVSTLSGFVANGHQTLPPQRRLPSLPRTGLPDSWLMPSHRSLSNHPVCPIIALVVLNVHRDRLPYRFPRNPHGIGASPVECRLAAFTRPNRVRFARDRWFTSGCSPPHLAVTQLPSVSGPRTWTWRGLPPLRHKTLSGAHPCRLVRQVKEFVGWLQPGCLNCFTCRTSRQGSRQTGARVASC